MTIKDIAAMCGVSVSTVSRVLNNHPYVKDEVREKVLKVIDEVHFVPHDGAVDLVKAQEDAIGLVVRGIGNAFFSDIIPIIERAVTDAGYTFLLKEIPTHENELHSAAALSKSKRLKGIILLGGRYDWTTEEVNALNVPFVCCTFTNSFGEVEKKRFSSVSIEDCEEAARAVDYLIEKGHKKIAIVLPSTSDHSVSELRFHGYEKSLKNHGIEFDEELVVETGNYSMESAHEGMHRLLRKRTDFTAVFTISDFIGIAVMKALDEAGRKVPADCSVIAIDGIDTSAYTIPTLTTLVQPREQMAVQAVTILEQMIKGETKYAHTQLSATLRSGGSVADNK